MAEQGTDDDATEWISWTTASERVGVPVPTIEYAVRINRIHKRSQGGNRPTLDALSVDRWAAWYHELRRQRKARPERRAKSTTAPLPPGEWLTTAEAAERLGVTTSTVIRHASLGLLHGHRTSTQIWVTESSVRQLLDQEGKWMFMHEAAEILGCSADIIPNIVAAGHLERRNVARVTPSISRSSVEAYAPVLAEQRAAAQLRHQTQLQRRAANQPPDDGQVWLSVPTTALLMGMTGGGVMARIHAGLLPATQVGRRWWLRRIDVEQAAAARVFAHRMDSLSTPATSTRSSKTPDQFVTPGSRSRGPG